MTEGKGAEERAVTEEDIVELVRVFYDRAEADELLGPLFANAFQDREAHLVIIRDFWSNVLLKTGRYTGAPFPPHMNLPIELEHFDRWLELFRISAEETLPKSAADLVVDRATGMTRTFRLGMFPFKGKDGRPSRTPGG